MNRYLNRAAASALLDVDLIVWLIDRPVWLPEDELVLERIKSAGVPVILVINKVDRLEDKECSVTFSGTGGGPPFVCRSGSGVRLEERQSGRTGKKSSTLAGRRPDLSGRSNHG